MSKTHESKNRILKEQIVEDIKAKLDGAQSVVICGYNGLNVADVTELRALCRAQDVHYCVLKNRLVLKALQEKGIEGLDHLLEGPNAFVFGMKDQRHRRLRPCGGSIPQAEGRGIIPRYLPAA